MTPKITILHSKTVYALIMARTLMTALSFAIILGACSVHRIDIQQGNVITQEMLEKLKIGMGKQQVSRLLGTPLIEDPFHKGRWDYIYKFVAGDTGEKQSSHITLFFDGENLTKIDIREAPLAEADVRKTTLKKR